MLAFGSSKYNILHEKLRDATNKRTENEKIIDKAASIILDDIRLRVYQFFFNIQELQKSIGDTENT